MFISAASHSRIIILGHGEVAADRYCCRRGMSAAHVPPFVGLCPGRHEVYSLGNAETPREEGLSEEIDSIGFSAFVLIRIITVRTTYIWPACSDGLANKSPSYMTCIIPHPSRHCPAPSTSCASCRRGCPSVLTPTHRTQRYRARPLPGVEPYLPVLRTSKGTNTELAQIYFLATK